MSVGYKLTSNNTQHKKISLSGSVRKNSFLNYKLLKMSVRKKKLFKFSFDKNCFLVFMVEEFIKKAPG